MAQRKKRDYKEDEIDLNAPSTKRTRYDYERDFYSLPQYNKPMNHHRYYLRSYEHRKPVDYCNFSQSSKVKSTQSKPTPQACAHITNQTSHPIVTRNAHSYSLNAALATRCSNSSTASGRRRLKQQALKKELVAEVSNAPLVNLRPRRKRKITQDEDVSACMSSGQGNVRSNSRTVFLIMCMQCAKMYSRRL